MKAIPPNCKIGDLGKAGETGVEPQGFLHASDKEAESDETLEATEGLQRGAGPAGAAQGLPLEATSESFQQRGACKSFLSL